MVQKLYPVKGALPVEEIRRILAEVRRAERDHTVTIGAPPFERNRLNQITALRLRFRPLPNGFSSRSFN